MSDYIFGPPPPPPPSSGSNFQHGGHGSPQRGSSGRGGRAPSSSNGRRAREQQQHQSYNNSGPRRNQGNGYNGGMNYGSQHHGSVGGAMGYSAPSMPARQHNLSPYGLTQQQQIPAPQARFNLNLVVPQAQSYAQVPISHTAQPTAYNPYQSYPQLQTPQMTFPSAPTVQMQDLYDDDDLSSYYNRTKSSAPDGLTENGPVPVYGTNIVLQSDDDIQKWIEERKKKWPTAKRMKEKEDADKERRKLVEQERADQETRRRELQLRAQEDSINDISSLATTREGQRPCKYFAAHGSCSRGDKCMFRHDLRSPNSRNKEPPPARNYKLFEKPARIPLFHRVCYRSSVTVYVVFANILQSQLAQSDWDRDNGKILDFISFLFDNGAVQSKPT
ncbi:nuclear fragile X mental retardation-interacting protein 1-domain-containing protein [Limtongia smithiae]|uniref:nuclear fragile X mental retardation-interacting protein 1-domain-containing protein n=1 Tax=Limtongia smithiae TaxID=1125753 RepID=UPI0034CE07C5